MNEAMSGRRRAYDHRLRELACEEGNAHLLGGIGRAEVNRGELAAPRAPRGRDAGRGDQGYDRASGGGNPTAPAQRGAQRDREAALHAAPPRRSALGRDPHSRRRGKSQDPGRNCPSADDSAARSGVATPDEMYQPISTPDPASPVISSLLQLHAPNSRMS